MENTQLNQVQQGTYHVRCKGSNNLQKALQREQAKRQLETGKRVSLMIIAEEWLEEKASQYCI